jgi:Hsp20/alpha crystallin family
VFWSNQSRIKASFENGLLQVEMPKREEARPRQIKITGGNGDGGKKEPLDIKAG